MQNSENKDKSIESRLCKKCLLRQENPDAYALVEKEKLRIKAADQTAEDEYRRRLSVCENCEKLIAGTCLACGCYVELRAAFKKGSCPRKMWKTVAG